MFRSPSRIGFFWLALLALVMAEIFAALAGASDLPRISPEDDSASIAELMPGAEPAFLVPEPPEPLGETPYFREETSDPYTGSLPYRLRLTGDWRGNRSALAERGLTFDLFATQFFDTVTSNGQQQQFEYGGKLDYLVGIDSTKLGLWNGLNVNFHAETRYGADVNSIDGLLAPSNLPMNFPAEGENVTAVTGFKISQAVSENLQLYVGKINTLDEFPLRFSPGLGNNRPGLAGFQNASLVFNSIVARTLPYSTFGVGVAWTQGEEFVLSLTAFDPDERATRGIGDPFARGVVFVPDLLWRTRFNGLPGAFNLGGTFSTAKYQSVDPAAYLNIPPSLVLDAHFAPVETGSWSLYSNNYQALWVDPEDGKRSWGVFVNLGLSDGNPNPIRYTAACGIAGRSPWEDRKFDTFGLGFFQLGLSSSFIQLAQPILPQQNESGVELFYNYAITPWCRLTYDMQYATASSVAYSSPLLNGLRLQVLF